MKKTSTNNTAEAVTMIDIANPAFILSKNNETARVRFLSATESEPVQVHLGKVPTNTDETKYQVVKCCGEGCPLCSAEFNAHERIYIPLYNYETKTIQFWDRSIRTASVVKELYKKYNDIPSFIFEIKRHGDLYDRNTSYEITAVNRTSYEYSETPHPDNLMYAVIPAEQLLDMISK